MQEQLAKKAPVPHWLSHLHTFHTSQPGADCTICIFFFQKVNKNSHCLFFFFLKKAYVPGHNSREILSYTLVCGATPGSHNFSLNFPQARELYNTCIEQQNREVKSLVVGGGWVKNNGITSNLPSTRSWPTCHNIAAILWSCPTFSQPLCCQRSSSDAAHWKIRHLIKETSAVAFWTTCRPILITLHHGKSSFISRRNYCNLTDRKTRISSFLFFFFFWSKGIGESS